MMNLRALDALWCILVHFKRFQEVLEIIFSHTFFHTLIYQKASVVSEHHFTFCAQIFKLPHVVLNQLGLLILFKPHCESSLYMKI